MAFPSCTDFNIQYNLSYITRFNTIKPLILANLTSSECRYPVQALADTSMEKCVAIAIFFVESSKKPTIFSAIQIKPSSYLDSSTRFLLEDQTDELPIIFTEDFKKLDFFMTESALLGFVGHKTEKTCFYAVKL